MVATEAGLPRTRRDSRSRPSCSSGSRVRRRSSASGAPVSTTVPLGSTTVRDSSVLYVLSTVPQAMPDELLATTPPMVQAPSLAGSGPNLRPYGASRAFSARTVTPGWTRTRAPSSSTSMPLKLRRTSTRTPSVRAWPLRLVPPERKVSGTPWAALARSSRPTSSALPATTTACGIRRKCEASWALAWRSRARVLTCAGSATAARSAPRMFSAEVSITAALSPVVRTPGWS